MPDKLGRELSAKLRTAGVKLTMGVRVENFESLSEPYSGTLTLSSGEEVFSDRVFPAIGSKAMSSLLETLPDIEKSNANRIKVDNWMRPSSLPNVFASGDVADMRDGMTIVAWRVHCGK